MTAKLFGQNEGRREVEGSGYCSSGINSDLSAVCLWGQRPSITDICNPWISLSITDAFPELSVGPMSPHTFMKQEIKKRGEYVQNITFKE